MNKPDKEWKLSQQALEFFVYANLNIVPIRIFKQFDYNSYIGIKEKEAWEYDEYRIYMCAKAAYKDLCRTLTYIDKYKDKKDSKKEDLKKKESAINNICFELTKKIYKYYNNSSINNIEPEKLFSVFIAKDGIIKENFELLSYLDKPKDGCDKFYFGQAQKWVNMTLKYLYLLGLIDSDKNLHIPIDSYILEAIWDKRDLNIKIPRNKKTDKEDKEIYSEEKYKEHREKYCYSDEKVKSWSQWDKEDYVSLRKNFSNYNMDWEHENWIRISEKRKGIDIIKKESQNSDAP